MNFTHFTKSHVASAMALVISEYKNEAAANKELIKVDSSDFDCCKTLLEQELLCMFQNNEVFLFGMVAFTDNGTMAGFIAFPMNNIEGFFGLCKGAWSPVSCNAFLDTSTKQGGMSRGKLASVLFQKVSIELSKTQHSSFALTTFAHNTEIIQSFVLNGFGIRCADAIKTLKPCTKTPRSKLHFNGKNFEIKMLYSSDLLSIYSDIKTGKLNTESTKAKVFYNFYSMREQLGAHLENSPTYFSRWPLTEENFVENLQEKKSCFFAAFTDDDLPVGYIQIFSGGENFISESLCCNGTEKKASTMAHICGTYVMNDYRGQEKTTANSETNCNAGSEPCNSDRKANLNTTLAEQILKFIEQTLYLKGYKKLGVDFETLNPTALRFWLKHFTAYTYSLHRRIDERCLRP